MVICCVPCCRSISRYGLSVHRFPANIEKKRHWITVISQLGNPRRRPWTAERKSVVCSKHFIASDYSISTTRKTLLPSAVPSVFEDLLGDIKRKGMKTVKSKQNAKLRSATSATRKTMKNPTQGSKRGRPPKLKPVSVINNVKNSPEKAPDKNRKLSSTPRIGGFNSGTEISKSSESSEENNSSDVEFPAGEPSNMDCFLEEDDSLESIILPLTARTIKSNQESDHLAKSDAKSTSVNISSRLKFVLHELVSTIEKQRSLISRLRKEKEVLNEEVSNLKTKTIKCPSCIKVE